MQRIRAVACYRGHAHDGKRVPADRGKTRAVHDHVPEACICPARLSYHLRSYRASPGGGNAAARASPFRDEDYKAGHSP